MNNASDNLQASSINMISRLRIRKTRACDNLTPRHEIQRLSMRERSHATHQVGVWWRAMNIFTAKKYKKG